MNFGNLNLSNVYYCTKKFKNYKNAIIHYTGSYTSIFEHNLADILTNCIMSFYEEKLVERLLNYNYFYFDSFEKSKIKDECLKLLNNQDTHELYFRRDSLWLCTYNYLHENRQILLQGFVDFRTSPYLKSLDYAIDISVNKFIMEREYNEFISLLKLYIHSKPNSKNIVHLIFVNDDFILLDENKNIIPMSDNNFDAKYLSDISFSKNDITLNTLLNILPHEIHLHLISDEYNEFIDTLKLVFENKIKICTDCNICKTYNLLNHELTHKV